MISYIRGKVIDRNESSVVIDVGGIGYEVWVPYGFLCSLERTDGEVEVYTYMQVREDGIFLFGFPDKQDLRIFKLLITVSGIGPKGALSIMSSMTTEQLILSVLSDDAKTIAKTPGIGAKTAGKLVIELKDKVSLSDTLGNDYTIAGTKHAVLEDNKDNGIPSSMRNEAVEALSALGYSPTDALKAVKAVEAEPGMTVDKLLKLALKNI